MAKTHLLFFALIGASLLTGCGDGSSGSSGGSSTSSSSAAPTNVRQAVDQAVAAGELPQLDTSASLLGSDANHDSVRDDIEIYIQGLPKSDSQKSALRQLAKSYAQTLAVDTSSMSAVAANDTQMGRAVHCSVLVFGSDAAGPITDDLEKYYFNTQARIEAYARYADALNGILMEIPRGNTCD